MASASGGQVHEQKTSFYFGWWDPPIEVFLSAFLRVNQLGMPGYR